MKNKDKLFSDKKKRGFYIRITDDLHEYMNSRTDNKSRYIRTLVDIDRKHGILDDYLDEIAV